MTTSATTMITTGILRIILIIKVIIIIPTVFIYRQFLLLQFLIYIYKLGTGEKKFLFSSN